MIGSYQTPTQLKDEDTYLRFFTKRELIQLIIVAVPSILIVRAGFMATSCRLICIFLSFCLAFILTGGMLLAMKLKMPDRMYLLGSGVPFDYFLIRVIRKAIKKKHVYINETEERGIS